MKRTSFIILLLLSLSYYGFSQDAYIDHHKLDLAGHSDKEITDHEAFFQGCYITAGSSMSECTTDQLIKFLANNIQYPKTAEYKMQEASCDIHFMVGKNGKVTQSVIKHCESSLFKESIDKALSELNFVPAKENGSYTDKAYAVNVAFTFEPF